MPSTGIPLLSVGDQYARGSSPCPIPPRDRQNLAGWTMQDGSYFAMDQFHSQGAHSDYAANYQDPSSSFVSNVYSGDQSPSPCWQRSDSLGSPSSVPHNANSYGPSAYHHQSIGKIGSDFSANTADEQVLFEPHYPSSNNDVDIDQPAVADADQSHLVAGAYGPTSVRMDEDDDVVFDAPDLFTAPLSRHLESMDHDDPAMGRHYSVGHDSLRHLSPHDFYSRTFGSAGSSTASGSQFATNPSTEPSSFSTSFPVADTARLETTLESLSRAASSKSTWSAPPRSAAALAAESKIGATIVPAQRRRGRSTSNPSTSATLARKAIRKGPLEPVSREKAGKMRTKGACQFCRDHKRSCALETPCAACVQAYGNDILQHPCRNSLAECITHVAMHKDTKWFPRGRSLTDFKLASNITSSTHIIPILLAFGPAMYVNVRVFDPDNEASIRHRHVVQTPEHRTKKNLSFLCDDLVLPIVLSDTEHLARQVDQHVGNLVDRHFKEFSWYRQEFNALGKIFDLYLCYKDRPTHQHYASLLQKALRLLCLIHANDISISTEDPATQSIYVNYIWQKFQPDNRKNAGLTACYVRAQFGTVIPGLARSLMTEVLQALFQLYDAESQDRLPTVVAVNVLLMMTIESIMYKGARVPYHLFLNKAAPGSPQKTQCCSLTSTVSPDGSEAIMTTSDVIAYTPNFTSLHHGEACADVLIKRYHDKFGTQHEALFGAGPHTFHSRDELVSVLGVAPASFLADMETLVRDAGPYLDRKKFMPSYSAQPGEESQDISEVFDRLTAKFFLG